MTVDDDHNVGIDNKPNPHLRTLRICPCLVERPRDEVRADSARPTTSTDSALSFPIVTHADLVEHFTMDTVDAALKALNSAASKSRAKDKKLLIESAGQASTHLVLLVHLAR